MDLLFFSISSHSNQGWEDAQWVECLLGKRGELSSASQNSGKSPVLMHSQRQVHLRAH